MFGKRVITAACAVAFVVLPLHAKNDKQDQLPPGLQKKAKSGKPLPPGWQKKIRVGERMDRTVFEQEAVIVSPRTPDGLITVRVDGKFVRLVQDTMEIVDILSR